MDSLGVQHIRNTSDASVILETRRCTKSPTPRLNWWRRDGVPVRHQPDAASKPDVGQERSTPDRPAEELNYFAGGV